MLALLLVLSWAATPSPPKSEASQDRDAQARAALNRQGSAFDACTERYLGSYPDAQGQLKLDLTIGPSGKVAQARAETELPGARNLRPCIEKVGKSVFFSPLGEGKIGKLSLNVAVEKGVKFRLWGPGETPPEPARKTRRTLVRFVAGDWGVVGRSE